MMRLGRVLGIALVTLGSWTGCGGDSENCNNVEAALCMADCDPADTTPALCGSGEWECPKSHPVRADFFGVCCLNGQEVAPDCSSGRGECPTGAHNYKACSCTQDSDCEDTSIPIPSVGGTCDLSSSPGICVP